MKKLAATLCATLLIFTVIVPTALFVTPQRVSAQFGGGCVGSALGSVFGIFSNLSVGGLTGVPVASPSLGGLLGSGNVINAGTAGATLGQCVFQLVVVPLAQSMIRLALQQVTANIINWINGNNGTGQPSFVQNLSRHLQGVSDTVAVSFTAQVNRVLNPTFGAAIASSLLVNYARGTSIGGFFAANQSKLARVSPNPAAFAAGDWSKGGTSAWLALSTQTADNPYLLSSAANTQLYSLINQAETNRRQDLVQSRGFLSWCGTNNQTSGAYGVGLTDSCTSGNVKTPGTVIADYTRDALGADIAQLVNPRDIDSSLAAIFTAALQQGVRSILGGTGLFGASQTSSIRPQAITNALQTSASSNTSVINSANAAANAALSRLSAYTTAWNSVASAANAAQTSVSTVKNSCDSQAGAADAALVGVQAVIAQAQSALNAVAGTQVLAIQVQQDAQDTSPEGQAKLNRDMQALAAAPPSSADVADAQAKAASTGGASANPAGSLSVSGGSLVDQMNLIDTNAQSLLSSCSAIPQQ